MNAEAITREAMSGAGAKRSTQTRYKLLAAIKREVAERLEQSLHKAVFIDLSNDRQPEQVQRLWDVEVKIGSGSTTKITPETKIIDVFDRAAGKLLILGAQGSGKTTTLLELAADLIARAENNTDQPIPVLFNLSLWESNNQSIASCLVDYLGAKYGVPVDISINLLNQQQILPLLDGLDELELSRQEICLQRINYLLDRLNQLVACNRVEVYKSGTTRLQMHGAIYLRSLDENQIRNYLLNARSRELWENIKTDPDLLVLAKTPLLLNIMTLSYEEILIHSWKRLTSLEERRQYLLNAYVRRMLIRDVKPHWYSKGKEPRLERSRQGLVRLAKNMRSQAIDELLIDNMQPAWLENSTHKAQYRLGVRLIFGVIYGLLASLMLGVTSKLVGGLFIKLIFTLILGLIGGIISGAMGSFILGLTDEILEKIVPFQPNLEKKLVASGGVKEAAIYGLIVVAIAILIFGTIAVVAPGISWIIAPIIGLLAIVYVNIYGLPGIQHFMLRLILWRNGYIPWNYSRFLNYAAQRYFLQRVGRRYRFMHDLFKEHFASM